MMNFLFGFVVGAVLTAGVFYLLDEASDFVRKML